MTFKKKEDKSFLESKSFKRIFMTISRRSNPLIASNI